MPRRRYSDRFGRGPAAPREVEALRVALVLVMGVLRGEAAPDARQAVSEDYGQRFRYVQRALVKLADAYPAVARALRILELDGVFVWDHPRRARQYLDELAEAAEGIARSAADEAELHPGPLGRRNLGEKQSRPRRKR